MENKTTLTEAASERARYLLAHQLGEPGVQAALNGISEVIREAWDGGKAAVDEQVTGWAMELAGIHEPHLHTDLKLYCHEHNGTKAHPCREYYIAQIILRQCGVTLVPDEAKMIAELGRYTGIRAIITEADGIVYADEESAAYARRIAGTGGDRWESKPPPPRTEPGFAYVHPGGQVVQIREITVEQAAAMVASFQGQYPYLAMVASFQGQYPYLAGQQFSTVEELATAFGNRSLASYPAPTHDTAGKPLPLTVEQMQAEMSGEDRARCIEAGMTPDEAFAGLWRRAWEAMGRPPQGPPPGYAVPGERCPDGGKCWHECTRGCFRVRTCGPLSAAGWGDTWPPHIRQQYGETDGHL